MLAPHLIRSFTTSSSACVAAVISAVLPGGEREKRVEGEEDEERVDGEEDEERVDGEEDEERVEGEERG
jgi:hypothetical protein